MSEPVIRVLENQDFPCFKGSIMSKEVPVPALNPTNFVISRKDPSVVYVGTLGTFICKYNSLIPNKVVFEERKKRGFDSQLVVQKLRLTKDKDLFVQLKTTHRFDILAKVNFDSEADTSTLKESAEGASLIFLY